jgi:hypothetical protein
VLGSAEPTKTSASGGFQIPASVLNLRPRVRSYSSGVFDDVGEKMILVSDLMFEQCLALSYGRTGGNLYFSPGPERELQEDFGARSRLRISTLH